MLGQQHVLDQDLLDRQNIIRLVYLILGYVHVDVHTLMGCMCTFHHWPAAGVCMQKPSHNILPRRR